VTTNYVYDGDNVVADSVDGTLARTYVTPFLDQNLGMTDLTGAAPATYYYSQDGLGSVRTLTDGSGMVANRYDYTAFGSRVATDIYGPGSGTFEAVPQRYTYTGREATQDPSLMDYRWRMYAPGTGRFVSRDPIGYLTYTAGNLYSYLTGQPTLRWDPFGLLEANPAALLAESIQAWVHQDALDSSASGIECDCFASNSAGGGGVPGAFRGRLRDIADYEGMVLDVGLSVLEATAGQAGTQIVSLLGLAMDATTAGQQIAEAYVNSGSASAFVQAAQTALSLAPNESANNVNEAIGILQNMYQQMQETGSEYASNGNVNGPGTWSNCSIDWNLNRHTLTGTYDLWCDYKRTVADEGGGVQECCSVKATALNKEFSLKSTGAIDTVQNPHPTYVTLSP
jgi:RHS repeat-associated protein